MRISDKFPSDGYMLLVQGPQFESQCDLGPGGGIMSDLGFCTFKTVSVIMVYFYK